VAFEEKPNPIGRVFLHALMLWAGVGCLVWMILLLVFGSSATKTAAPGEILPDVRRAHELFAQRCVPCHGSTGHGDGPASANLNPKPRQFANATWQASISDDQIESTIRLGGAAMGKSSLMPPNPDLERDPALLAGLRVVVREFRR